MSKICQWNHSLRHHFLVALESSKFHSTFERLRATLVALRSTVNSVYSGLLLPGQLLGSGSQSSRRYCSPYLETSWSVLPSDLLGLTNTPGIIFGRHARRELFRTCRLPPIYFKQGILIRQLRPSSQTQIWSNASRFVLSQVTPKGHQARLCLRINVRLIPFRRAQGICAPW